MICQAVDNNTKKFQEITSDNAAALVAVAWAGLNFSGSSIDGKVENALSFINDIKQSNPQTKTEAGALLSKLESKGLIAKERGSQPHYSVKHPELIQYMLKDMGNTISLGFGDISGSGNKYNYAYHKTPANPDSDFMADFDKSSKKSIEKVGDGMVGFVLMSTDGVVSQDRVNQTVDYIAERIARDVINGEPMDKTKVNGITKSYMNLFIRIKDAYSAKGSEKGVAHMQSYLDNWDNLESMIFYALKRRSGLSFKDSINSKKANSDSLDNPEGIQDNNEDLDLEGADKSQSNYSSDYSITLDSKAGLSGKLKLFLSTLENGDKHYLTKDPLFEKFDTVYNTLNAFLAGSNPNIFEMIERLKEFQEYQWVSNLIAKLNEAMEINSETKLPKNMTLIKQFVTAMNKHYINMHHVQWSKSGGEYKMDVFGDNSNSRTRVILNDWSTRMQSSNLVSVDEFGRRVINPAEAQKALELFDGLFKNKFNSSKKEVFDAFDRIGIRLSYPAIERMLSGNFTYGARKFAIGGKNQLFLESDSHSPISNVYKTLIAMANTDGNVELGSDSKLDMFSNGSVKALATFEARFSKHLYSNSHRSGNKTVFSYTNDKFIADRVNALISDYKSGNKDGFALIKELENDVFAKDSYWLQQLKLAMDNNNPQEAFDFIDNFEFGYLSLEPIKKSKGKSTDSGLVDLSPQEIIATKLGLLHNNDLKAGSRRVGRLFYPTMSDKSNMLTIQSLLRGNIIYKDGSIDDDTIEFIFDKVVSAEMNRMWEVSKSTDGYRSSTGIESYDNGSRIFYTIPELNILKEIFKINENNVRVLKSEAELSNENILSIKDAIKDSMNMMIQNQIEEFKNNGIGYNKETGFIDYVDSNHIANIKSWHDLALSNSEVSDAIAADYAINYFIHNVNIAQLFHGDYALYNKSNLESFDKNYESREFNLVDAYNLIKPTFDNLGKRLAADLAPGYEADYGTRTQIKVTVSNDREVPATAYELAEKVFSGNSQTDKNALDAWSKLNSSDAQSWVSLDFHLDTLFNFGNKNVNEDDYFKLKAKIAKANSDKKDVEFSQDELKLILQPTKPLYSNNTQEHIGDGKTIGVRHYIKTSSFPLIPQLVKGSELENFMRAMEKNEIDMHVFASGYKVGASSTHKLKGADNNGKISIFNEDGSMNVDNVNELGANGNFTILPIAGYKIQQEVPYHDHPGMSNKGTQESKALLTNIKNLTGFKYGDNDNLTGAELEEIYNNKYKQLYEKQALKLRNEIFKKAADGSLSNSVDVQKLQSILKEEANGRGYSINDLLGLDIEDFENAFKYPLWALPSAKQYESLIISIVDNRVRKLKIPGNSFVLGSEAGFRFKTIETFESGGMDTIKKYQDKIIFTSKFNGEYLQSYRTDGDGVKPSQVFVPMKLKGSDGHFIDLMKYTFIKDGKIILDESRLPKSVLKLFGFRIPTQGHNSMAALEIAGFLPEECGDLIIASQDLVVQMGSDFDIDKLYTYNYSTKEIYDNGVPRVILDNEFSLENDILDIHLSVFNNNNPELYKLIMSPNGFGQLKTSKSTGLSFDIDNIKTIASGAAGTTNFLSPQYQMSKFFNGVSGKMGVGVFSSLSMLNSIAQEKGLEYVQTDENGTNTFNVRFGDQLSIGKLGSVKTLNDKYYISKVIEAFQSASVDNEKEQILYKLNINKYTVSAINALAMLGFDEEVICYFINQPIIEEFVAKSMSNDSSLNGFVETLNNDVALDMIDDYKKKYKGLEINNSFKNAGVDALKEQMSIPTNIRETIPIEYYSKQLAMLEKFSELTKVGQDLQSLMQTINAESKGLGRTIFGSIDRESKVDNIDSVKTNISNGIPTTGVLNAGRLLDNTMNGFVIDYGTRMLNSVGAQLFPYRNEDLLSTMSFVSSILEKKGSSISSTEEFMYDIFTAMKSYIFSNPNLYGKDFNPTQKRKDLFLGETEIVSNGLDGQYRKNIRVVTKPSLADTINAIKDLEIGKSNALLRALSVDLSQKSSDFKLVKYMASASQNLDESDIHQAFISLFRENVPVEYKVGDRIFSTTTTELAENLIMYAYLSGGTQEAIQFTKYIPIDVLDYMGFMDKLSSMSDRINPGTFGNTLNENKQIVESKFAEQYIQNNPSIVPTKIGDVGYDAKKSNKISNFEYGIIPGHGKIITKFKPKVSEDPKNSPGAALVSKKYIGGSYMTSDYIPGIGATNVKHVNVVYKKIGDYFVLMPTLGSFGVSEYSSSSSLSEVAKSSISNRNILDQSQYNEIIKSVGTPIDEPKESLFKDFNENEIIESGNPVEFILTKISDMYGDPLVDDHLVSMAKRMLMNTHIVESLSDLKFEYATKNFTPAGRYTYGSKLLQINGNESRFNNKNHLVETLLHELEHSYTSRMIRLIEDKEPQIDNSEEYNSIPQHVFDAYNEINQTRRGLLHIASRLNTNLMKEIENAKNYSVQQDRIKRGKTIPEDELIVAGRDFSEFAYGMAGNLDFVTMVSTNNSFRESIDNLGKQYKSGKSIVDKIFDALLKFLGLDTMPSNLKDHFKEQVLKFNNAIDMSIAKEASLKSNPSFNQKFDDLNKFFDELESGKFDKKVIKLNRDEHGINNKFELGSGNSEFSMDVPDFNEVNRLPFKDNRKLYKDLKLVKLNGDRKMISKDNKSFLKYINNFNGNEDNKYTMKTVDVYGDGKQFYVSVYKKNKPEISGLNNLFLIPSQSEVRALEAQFGPTAMDQYNALPNEDKRRILKCLKI